MAIGQYGYRGGANALPGRVATYFNNPYMKQIAGNLSQAIYGDPRDDLVREQIANAQATRARQAEQDQIAADERARTQDLQSQFGGSLAASMLLPEEERMPVLAEAIQAYTTNGGRLNDLQSIIPYAFNQGYQADRALLGQRGDQAMEQIGERGRQTRLTQDDLAQIRMWLQKDDQNFQSNESLLDRNWRSGESALGHTRDIQRDMIGFGHDLALQDDRQSFDKVENQLDRAEGVLGGLFDEGLSSDPLANYIFGDNIDPNLLATLEPLPDGGGRSTTGRTVSTKPSDIQNMRYSVNEAILGRFGPVSGQLISEDVRQATMTRASQIYETNGNWQEAVNQAVAEMESTLMDQPNVPLAERVTIPLAPRAPQQQPQTPAPAPGGSAPASTEGWSAVKIQ